MPAEDKETFRILAIEPGGFRGHRNLNTFFLRVLGAIGCVTFAAPEEYLDSCEVYCRINIPSQFLRYKTKFGARWSQFRVLNYILRNVSLDNYDAVVFLAYETISFSLRWPRSRKVFLFEHNNIENARGSRIKTFAYEHLSPNAIHLAFLHHIAKHIKDRSGRSATYIPHPYYRRDVSESGICSEFSPSLSTERTIIFSPSASTPGPIQDKLKRFASEGQNSYYAICKGATEEKTDACEVRPFFDNYENLMRTCDMVFLGACFNYRVSSVAYEALSYKKPLLLLDSPFARALHNDYPHLVFPVKDMDEIPEVVIDREAIRREHAQFLREHSYDAVCGTMAHVLGRCVGKMVRSGRCFKTACAKKREVLDKEIEQATSGC